MSANARTVRSPGRMGSRRARRRLVRHHVPAAIACAVVLGAVMTTIPATRTAAFRWSMATAYASLALLGATLVVGPLAVLRGRPNPVSTDLRRDLGIWAAAMATVHFLVGWQVHMKHRYLYWFREVPGSDALVLRRDLFGLGNYSGLAAVLIATLLLGLSNDWSLRRLGASRWKLLQQWNYALLGLVVVHGAAYQVVEHRSPAVVALGLAMVIVVVGLQLAGVRAFRAERRPARASYQER